LLERTQFLFFLLLIFFFVLMRLRTLDDDCTEVFLLIEDREVIKHGVESLPLYFIQLAAQPDKCHEVEVHEL
jgi:hypothetical protein